APAPRGTAPDIELVRHMVDGLVVAWVTGVCRRWVAAPYPPEIDKCAVRVRPDRDADERRRVGPVVRLVVGLGAGEVLVHGRAHDRAADVVDDAITDLRPVRAGPCGARRVEARAVRVVAG